MEPLGSERHGRSPLGKIARPFNRDTAETPFRGDCYDFSQTVNIFVFRIHHDGFRAISSSISQEQSGFHLAACLTAKPVDLEERVSGKFKSYEVP
jgi:hypothetical protein